MLGFRVWNGSNVYEPDEDEYMCSPTGELYKISNSGRSYHLSRSAIAMQSTGLKDSRDVVVFEGDVVQISCADTVIKITVHSASTFLMSMGVLDDSFNIEHDKSIEECMQVIGNIYECPALLERLK